MFKMFISFAFGKQGFYQPDRIARAHKNLGITNFEFSEMKIHILKSFHKYKVSTDILFRIAEIIESYRLCIRGKETSFEGIESGSLISNISKNIYFKVQDDMTLNPYFKNIDISLQIMKFGKLFAQLVSSSDSPNISLEQLRKNHAKYFLTYFQFSFFKLHCYHTLKEMNVRDKEICQIMKRMENFKYSILNLDSFSQMVQKS